MSSGGIYRFRCSDGGCDQELFEKFVWGDGSGETCPTCGKLVNRVKGDERAYGAEFAVPYLSRAWGVSPNQINDAKKNFPSHEFAKDGQMVIRSVKEYDRVRKDLGM